MNSQQLSVLRQNIRKKRRNISASEQMQHSKSIIQHLISSQLYQNSQNIALYISTDGEVDLATLFKKLFYDNKKIFLPVILSPQKAIMHFAAYHRKTLLEKNCFGILEPWYKEQHVIPIEQLDLILAPLVGFDGAGNRIGMGEGYYDRALQHLKKGETKTQFFGVAHEIQKVRQLEPQKWDVPLNGIITEERLSYF